MSDPSSPRVFSIDPGIVNLGVCCYDKHSKKIEYANCERLADKIKNISEHEVLRLVHQRFFGSCHISKMLAGSSMVLIEIQMKRKFLLVQHAIGAYCIERGYAHKFVSPRSVKVHFDIGKSARDRSGAGVRGKSNNYAANKKQDILVAESLHPSFMRSLPQGKKDDVADAILQARYFADKSDVAANKKTAVKKTVAKKTAPKKTAPKKTAPKKTIAKKTAKKTIAKKTAKKTIAKKTAPKKKTPLSVTLGGKTGTISEFFSSSG